MDHRSVIQTQKYKRKKKIKSRLQKLVMVLACVVVFCTTYALILPAITTKTEIFCGIEEHTHTVDCYKQVSSSELVLTCTPQLLGVHSHTLECRDVDGSLICGQVDYVAHSHDELCYDGEGSLVCTLPEYSTHVHSEDCYADIPVEPTEAPHVHEDSCYADQQGELVCGLQEQESHSHGEDCYVRGEALICTSAEEGHVHEDACYEQLLQCELEEGEGHSHGEDCYQWTREVICGMEEATSEAAVGETVGDLFQTPPTHELICGQIQAVSHAHGDSCFHPKQQLLTCTLEENETHSHTELCYGVWELICEKEEHIHDATCYADQKADLEDAEDWEATFADVELTGHWQRDVLAIARTQLGYAESSKNYIITEGGSQKGYSRYGAWYGDMYGDWCAMFTSFCMHYAGVEGIPLHSGCTPWIRELKEMNLYRESGTYEPEPGDLIFYDWEGDGLSDHVGFVSELRCETAEEPAQLIALEGNSSNRVQYVSYDPHDERICGYGQLSRNRLIPSFCGFDEHVHEEACYDEDGTLTCTLEEHSHNADCNSYKVVYHDDQIRAFVYIENVLELPQDLSLQVTPITAESDQSTFDSMQVALSEEMASRTEYVGAAAFYSLHLYSEGQPYELPEEARIKVDMSFTEPVFTAEQMEQSSGTHTYLITPDPDAQQSETDEGLVSADPDVDRGAIDTDDLKLPQKGESGSLTLMGQTPSAGSSLNLSTQDDAPTVGVPSEEELTELSPVYQAALAEAGALQESEEGITGVSFRSGELATVALALTRETVTGTFWERVYSTDDLTADGVYMIVSAEGNYALVGNSSTNYKAVSIQTVKGNDQYYIISDSDDTNLHWKFNGSGTSYTIQNVGSSRYLNLNSSTFISTSSSNVKTTFASAEKCWRLTYGSYSFNTQSLHNTGSGAFTRVRSSGDADSDMMIFKLSDVKSLEIPADVLEENAGGGAAGAVPEKPDYPDFITPSGSKTGDTALVKDLDGNEVSIKGKYYSDPATSNIEKEYRKDTFAENELNDGKVLTDKSVIYRGDDYGAFASYDANTFGVTLSTLGQDYKVPYQDVVKTPVDVVFVLDVSGSMATDSDSDDNQDGRNSNRLKDMVTATNASMKQIFDDHPENRVGIAVYSGGAWELLPLDRYTADNDEYLIYKQTTYRHPATNSNYSIWFAQGSSSLKNESGESFADVGSDAIQGFGTYTQAGIAMGQDIFEAIGDDTTYTTTIGSEEHQRTVTVIRQPVMILVSDGEPTYSTNNYMDPLNGPHYGNGNGNGATNAKGVHGYYTVLTANYSKRMVSIQYQKPALFYTIGMYIYEEDDPNKVDTGSNTPDDYKIAVLNPTVENVQTVAGSPNAEYTSDVFKQMMLSTYENRTLTVAEDWEEVQLGVPHIVEPVLQGNPYENNYSYADDAYFGEITEAELKRIFNEIYASSIKSAPYGFILYKNSEIDLVDNIGVGMEIKGTPVLRYNGVNYTEPTVSVSGAVTTYTYTGTHKDPYIPDREMNLEEIKVMVIENDDGTQTVEMYVPDSVLPTYTPETVGLEYYYEMLPVRLIYQVGLTEAAEQQVLALQNTGGEVTFYTNKWVSENDYAHSTLIPSDANPYYIDQDLSDNIVPGHQEHQEEKTENTTGTFGLAVDCHKYTDVEFDNRTRIEHTLGNNGKLVFKSDTTEIPVEKKWERVNADIMNPVVLELYKVTETVTEEEVVLRSGTLFNTVTLNAENAWKGTFTGVPIPDDSWYYVVVEKQVPGFQSFYSGELISFTVDNQPLNGVKVDFAEPKNGSVTVTNAPAVELPPTGRYGTLPYTLGGCLLIAAAGAALMYTRHGRRRRGERTVP